jgi:hypothetical protein
MRLTSRTIHRSAALAAVLTLSAGLSWSDDAKPNPQDVLRAMEEAAKPGPEHAKLEPLAGSWTYTCKCWMDPSQPPMESKGTIERRWVLGGRFLEEKIAGTGFDGKPGFEGLGLIGFDNGRQKYTMTWNSTACTGTCTGLGSADESGQTFTFHTEAFCPVQKKVIKSRDQLRFESADRTVAETYMLEEGQEFRMMEIVAVRKK